MVPTKIFLNESEMPRQWYNIQADLPRPHAARAASRYEAARGPRRPLAHLSDGADHAGGHHRALGGHPAADPERVPHLAPDAARAREAAGKGARYSRPDLLQVGGRESRRQPQTQHCGAAGLVQQERRREAPGHRDRRGPVGQRAVVRDEPLRPRVQGLHGARELRPEAVPANAHGDVGRQVHRQPEQRDQRRPRRAREGPRLAGLAGHRDQRGGRGCGHARGHQVLARQRA